MNPEQKTPLLELRGVSKYYTGGESVVMGLNNVSLSFRAGEFVAVTGESGSGKSTLAHILSGIVRYESGEMLVQGRPTSHFDGADWERYRRDSISFISQNYGILAGSTVLSNVVSALRLSGMDKVRAARRAEELLKLVELWELRTRRAGKLSSGQKQRLSIARALAKPAPILIADEPTGNLDPASSAKVIALLRRAAGERLVILITHDFQEAEDCATRRITLQDGHVALDAPLREPETPGQTRETKPAASRQLLSPYIAGLQMGGRPVWSALVLLFFALTAFGVFAFLGTFLVNLDDTGTRIYDNSGFRNGEKTRIVVQRSDGEAMEQEDLEALLGVSYVEYMEQWGYVTDVNYAWQQGVDYQVHYSVRDLAGVETYVKESVELLDSMDFLQTVPVFADGREFLTAGRLPENLYEVVLAGSADRIGETIPVYIRDVKSWNMISYIYLEVEVVGVTDWGSGLYFDAELGRVFTNFMMAGGKFNETWMIAPASPGQLSDGECLLSEEIYGYYKQMNSRRGKGGESVTIWLRNSNMAIRITDEVANNPAYFTQLEVTGTHDSPYSWLAMVSPAVFDQLAWAGNSNQVSLFVRDYAYTQRVLEELAEMGYTAVSPFRQCSTEKDPALAAERMQTLTVCLGALAAIVLLQLLALRELFGVQTESYKLLADIGLGWETAKRSLLWQVLAFTAGGQILGFGSIGLCAGLGVDRIVGILHYLTPGGWICLSGVHLAVTLLALAAVAAGLRRRVYPASAEAGDLKLDEEAAL